MDEPRYLGTIDTETGKTTPAELGAQPPIQTEKPITATTTTEITSDPPPATETVVEPVVAQNIDYLKSINEKAGLQFQNDDELVNEIKASIALKEKLSEYETTLKAFRELDPMALDIDKARKAGIGIDLYLDAVKMDVEKLDAKTTLKEAFLRKNAELVASDPEFAKMKFEREFKAKFGKLDDKLDVSGLDEFEAKEKTLEFNQEQDFIKRSLNADAMQDKKWLAEWKKQNITIPDVPRQQGMTDEQIQQYHSQADLFVGQNDKIEIPIGDKKFNFGLKDYGETLKKELHNPIETLKEHGIDLQNGTIDPVKLGKLLTANYIAKSIGKPLSDWSVDARNIEYLKTKKDMPAPSQTIAAGAVQDSDDLLAQFSKGIKAQMAAQSQS
jgi:hypothetical protein